jgi:hypothetical protein
VDVVVVGDVISRWCGCGDYGVVVMVLRGCLVWYWCGCAGLRSGVWWFVAFGSDGVVVDNVDLELALL